MKHKILLILAKMWLVFALAIIFLGYFQAYNDGGWSEVANKLSSINMGKIIGFLITLSPGFVLLWWAKEHQN
ncbi:MAG: hypothetical protein GXO12_00060 [Epsilonproteobacteria bacterium]|nr:hypothetical protein [Campylobacterota bacterium]